MEILNYILTQQGANSKNVKQLLSYPSYLPKNSQVFSGKRGEERGNIIDTANGAVL